MKILPKDYDKAQGTPFRVEDYRGKKLEFYYLDDRADYRKFAQRGRFSVWTSNGEDFRLFVDKGYYEAVKELYENEINTIWLDFTLSIYGEQKKMSKKYLTFSMIMFVSVLILMMVSQMLFSEYVQPISIGAMVVMLIGLFVSSNKQQRELRDYVQGENTKASQMIKDHLGVEKFEEVLKNQELYYQQYFKVDLDTEEINEEENQNEVIEKEKENEEKDDKNE